MTTEQNLRDLRTQYRKPNNLDPLRAVVAADSSGNYYDPVLHPGKVYVSGERIRGWVNGARTGLVIYPGLHVIIEFDEYQQYFISRVDGQSEINSGYDPNITSQPPRQSMSQDQLETLRVIAQGDLVIYIKSWVAIVNNTGYQFLGNSIDIGTAGAGATSLVPGAGLMCYVVVFVQSDYSTLEAFASTPRSIDDLLLGVEDWQECLDQKSAGSTPVWAIPLSDNQSEISQDDIINGVDLRNLVNNDQSSGSMTSFSVAADSGTPILVTDGDTLDIVGDGATANVDIIGGQVVISATGGSGDVTGPGSATDNALTRFDGTTGKVIQNGTATEDDSGNITATSYKANGTGGNGFIEDVAQSSSPAAPAATGWRAFATSVGMFAWRVKNGADTYVRSFIGALSADRTYTLPDTSGQIALTSDIPAAGITQLTGDVTAGPGSGSQSATVASVGGASAANVAKAAAALSDKFLLQTADATNLPNAQAMGALATGIVKNTNSTGVQSIAVAGTDYTSPTGTENLSNKTITASSLVATALSLLIGGFKAIFTHSNTADQTYTLRNESGTLQMQRLTTKGDLLTYDTGDVRLGVGSDNKVLTADSSQAKGVAWNYQETEILFFGDGSDGDLTASSGTTTLTRDTYYNNITLSGTAKIDTRGYHVFYAGTLNLDNAGAGAIFNSGTNGNNNSNVQAGAGGGAGGVGNTVGAGQAGATGGNGGTATNGAGVIGGTGTSAAPSNGGSAGNGGSGGAGTGGAGGAGPAGTSSSSLSIRRWAIDLLRGASLLLGGAGGGGGGGGGAAGNAGSGGGGGGGGGGTVWLSGRTISRGASTAAGCISAVGGNGGNGGTVPAGANVGAGGGGGGGGGGWIYLAYQSLTGSSAANALDASGGTGGTGGNAVGGGTGTGGDGGGGGAGGRITLVNIPALTISETVGVAGTGGTAHTGATGGGGGAGNSTKVAL